MGFNPFSSEDRKSAYSKVTKYDPLNIVANTSSAAEKLLGGGGDGESQQEYADRLQGGIQTGMKQGKAKAEEMYGYTGKEVGGMTHGIVEARKAATTEESPIGSEIRRSQRLQEQRLREQQGTGGNKLASERKAEQSSRATAATAAAADYQAQNEAMNQYQEIVGNMAKNQGMMPYMYGQLYTAGMAPQEDDSNIFGF